MTADTWAAIAAVAVALLAVLLEHLWVQRRIRRLENASEFRAVVEQPIETFEKVISDLVVEVDEWGLERGDADLPALRKSWIRTSRDLNRLIIKLADRADFQPKGGWLKVSTEEVDGAFSIMSDESRNLSSSTTKQCLERLGRAISDAVREVRPS